MRYHNIITSLLDQDLYKFSMGQAIYHQFSDYKTTWTFKCRNEGVYFTEEMLEEIREQVRAYCELHFTEDELTYLGKITWLKESYVDFLRLWQPRFEDFVIDDAAPCGLRVEATGTWLNTSMYEVPVLAIVNEVYFRISGKYEKRLEEFEKHLDHKIEKLAEGRYQIGAFSEFGLRRRLSAEAQELAVKKFGEAPSLGNSK